MKMMLELLESHMARSRIIHWGSGMLLLVKQRGVTVDVVGRPPMMEL